jgi:hypothetical protein
MADNQFINFNSQDVADMYRRNQYARMLQEQANAPIERASYKGIEAPIHPVQGVAKMAAALLAGYQQNQMDKSYASEKAAAEQKLVAEQERRRGEVADYMKGFEPTLSAGPSGGPGDYGTPATISTPKSRGELLAHAMRGVGSDIPQVANMGRMQYEQQNAMAQDEARTAERAATEATRVKERQEDIKIRADDRKAAREDAAAQRDRPNIKPMTAQQESKFLGDMSKSHSTAKASLDAMDEVSKSIKSVRDAPGLSRATGVMSYIPSYPDSPAAIADTRLKNLEGKMTMLGKAAAAASGSIGPMAVQEWKIVRDMVAAIDPSKGEKALTEQLDSVEDQLAGSAQRLRESYDNQYSDYYDKYPKLSSFGGAQKTAEPAPATKNKGATVSNWNK